MEIQIVESKITKKDLEQLAKLNYGDMVKGVVDLKRKIAALGGQLHADAEAVLLKRGSAQQDLWGFNVYVNRDKNTRLEYTSFINIRPAHGNRAIEIQDPQLRTKIREVVDHLIE